MIMRPASDNAQFMRTVMVNSRSAARGELKGIKPPPLSNQNIYGYFLSFFNNIVNRDRVHCRMFFGRTTRRSNTFVIKPSGYELSRFEKY